MLPLVATPLALSFLPGLANIEDPALALSTRIGTLASTIQ